MEQDREDFNRHWETDKQITEAAQHVFKLITFYLVNFWSMSYFFFIFCMFNILQIYFIIIRKRNKKARKRKIKKRNQKP